MKLFLPAAALAAAAALSGCGDLTAKRETPKKTPEVQTIFVHGDPKQAIAGATLDGRSFIDAARPDSLDGFTLANGLVLTHHDPVEEETRAKTRETLEEQEAAREDRRAQAPKPTWEMHPETDESWHYAPKTGDDPLELAFKVVDGRFALVQAFGRDVTPLHYSLKADGEAFSILFEGEWKDYGKSLVALYFVKRHEGAERPADVEKDYRYLLGPGVVTRWGGDVKVDICGAPTPDVDAVLRSATLAWSKDGRVGQRSLTVGTASAPFSDMNSNCLQVVDDYLFESIDWAAMLGFTLPVVDDARQEIIAADVLISRKAFAKIMHDTTPALFAPTVTHEIGHFLGLDHEFAKDPDGAPKYPSIMGYSGQRSITPHDIEAIERLYGPY